MTSLNSISYQAILRLTIPALIQGLLTTIVFITDRLILAKYSEVALGSMQISGPIGWISTTLFGSFTVGMASFIGRSWGAKKNDETARYLGAGLCLSFLMGLILAGLGMTFTNELCLLMVSQDSTTPELRQLAELYLYYLFPSTPIQIMAGALVSSHQSIGNTKLPMFATLGAGLINLSVSVVLVHGLFGFPELGVEGAAIGTVSAFAFSFIANLAPFLPSICAQAEASNADSYCRSCPTIGGSLRRAGSVSWRLFDILRLHRTLRQSSDDRSPSPDSP